MRNLLPDRLRRSLATRSPPAVPPARSDIALAGHAISKSLGKGRARSQVLTSVDFTARRGEITMLTGPSGSGKSTLLAILSGLLLPDSGSVQALGIELGSLSTAQCDRFRLRNCGFVFQGFNLSPALAAWQQVAIVLRCTGMSASAARTRAEAALDSVGLGARVNQKPSELSGGEQQRVAIARAIAKDPMLLFADEPTSALDRENGEAVIRLLEQAAGQRGAAIICVTHDQRLESYAHRLVRMEDGRIQAPDAPLTPHLQKRED
ncbi:ABC transporter ATP-binding protein [Sphingomonas sp. DG1-23]|uniref:ABC transporter ATP-binding protein n=1 Tax=Sphingomonas sp. DG1-23 TaxID=3068316 RepID=UPI00273F2884|nr:ABC transporter ATP-binding protein [Sphingomonas sp. DG1-23]MDP5279863.1 ABC transporter ATP-binding protein [Sphingomonas sp. DG1-23]